MKNSEAFYTLCEAITWIAFRESYRIESLEWAQKYSDKINLDDQRIVDAMDDLKGKLAQPNSGILVVGVDENTNKKISEEIPWQHFLADIEFYIIDETISSASKTLNSPINHADLPRWKEVKLLKKDINGEWPQSSKKAIGHISAETACKQWLLELVKSPKQKSNYEEYLLDAQEKYGDALSKKAFRRAWDTAKTSPECHESWLRSGPLKSVPDRGSNPQ